MPHKLPFGRSQTIFCRIPGLDWSAVLSSEKTEVRTLVGGKGLSPYALKHTPCPAVIHTTKVRGVNPHHLAIIERAWTEPLGSLTPESIRREGFESFTEFKQYWLLRRDAETPGNIRSEWSPLKEVNVIRLRLMRETDYVWAGDYLFHRLYGNFIP